MYAKLSETASYIQSITKIIPSIGIVLGSGLGSFVDTIEDKIIINYNDIPHFPNTTVEGHSGRLIIGKVQDTNIVVLQGRLHSYEGLPMEDVVFPVRVLASLGIETLLLTNASGGINKSFSTGDLIIIEDHLNLMGRNPLIGPNNNDMGPRFPDMTEAYDMVCRKIIKDAMEKENIQVNTGVYAGVLGPTYETPAEIKMLNILGADMVGMSTVPECIAANHLGIKVCGISIITNMAAGIDPGKLSHDDVKEEAIKVMDKFSKVLLHSIPKF